MVTEGEMFVIDKSNIMGTVGSNQQGVMHFSKLLFDSDKQKFGFFLQKLR